MCCFRAGPFGLFVCLLFSAIGCSQKVELNPVQGKVLHKGQPLANAAVTFVPAATEGGTKDFPVGTTKEDGTFTVKTGGADGAPAGTYKVTIVCMEAAKATEGMSMGAQEDRLKGVYSNPTASTISAEIKVGDNQLPPFELK